MHNEIKNAILIKPHKTYPMDMAEMVAGSSRSQTKVGGFVIGATITLSSKYNDVQCEEFTRYLFNLGIEVIVSSQLNGKLSNKG